MNNTYLLCFNQRSRDTDHRDKSDTEGIIIIIIQRPQDDAGDLEDIKRVYNLKKFIQQYAIRRK